MAKKKTKTKTQPKELAAIKHAKASRSNIPSQEERHAVKDEDKKVRRYAFDLHPSQCPQLLWAGKSREERLLSDAPLLYKQENISPQMIVEDLRATEREKGSSFAKGSLGSMAEMFEQDFDGLSDKEKVEFYQHQHSWQNRMIFGDSLQVMTSLLEREGMREQVQCVYIDPPYGIKFGSNWQVSTRKREVKDKREDMTTEAEAVRAFRDTWKLGIHSYLEYWRARFVVAREMLKETGSIFVQISDDNVHLMRCLLDETFGSENFIALIPFRKKNNASRC